jgi:dolichyl-phosphate beta-glucosyltransferase
VGAGLALALDRLRGEPAWTGASPAAGRAVLAGAVAVAVLPLVPVPLPARDAPQVPPFFTSGDPALDCPGGSVLVLPFPAAPYTDAMAWQQAGGITFAMPGGYFIGPAVDGRAYVGGQPTATGRLFRDVHDDGVVREPTAELRARFRADLARWGTCAVVLGPGRNVDPLTAQTTALVGAPPDYVGGVAVWRDLMRLPR